MNVQELTRVTKAAVLNRLGRTPVVPEKSVRTEKATPVGDVKATKSAAIDVPILDDATMFRAADANLIAQSRPLDHLRPDQEAYTAEYIHSKLKEYTAENYAGPGKIEIDPPDDKAEGVTFKQQATLIIPANDVVATTKDGGVIRVKDVIQLKDGKDWHIKLSLKEVSPRFPSGHIQNLNESLLRVHLGEPAEMISPECIRLSVPKSANDRSPVEREVYWKAELEERNKEGLAEDIRAWPRLAICSVLERDGELALDLDEKTTQSKSEVAEVNGQRVATAADMDGDHFLKALGKRLLSMLYRYTRWDGFGRSKLPRAQEVVLASYVHRVIDLSEKDFQVGEDAAMKWSRLAEQPEILDRYHRPVLRSLIRNDELRDYKVKRMPWTSEEAYQEKLDAKTNEALADYVTLLKMHWQRQHDKYGSAKRDRLLVEKHDRIIAAEKAGEVPTEKLTKKQTRYLKKMYERDARIAKGQHMQYSNEYHRIVVMQREMEPLFAAVYKRLYHIHGMQQMTA
jgi:hypothetical protein